MRRSHFYFAMIVILIPVIIWMGYSILRGPSVEETAAQNITYDHYWAFINEVTDTCKEWSVIPDSANTALFPSIEQTNAFEDRAIIVYTVHVYYDSSVTFPDAERGDFIYARHKRAGYPQIVDLYFIDWSGDRTHGYQFRLYQDGTVQRSQLRI